jgi:hypothetical protein
MEAPMKLVTSLVCALLFAFASTLALAGEGGCQSACADGFTFSSEKGMCVPKTVTS